MGGSLSITAWGEGRAVGAIVMPNNDVRFVLAGGKPGVALPAPAWAPKPEKPAGEGAPAAAALARRGAG